MSIELCADTTAGWHESWLAALGLRSERRGAVWRAIDPPPFIYWTAITLNADATEADTADAHGTICDSWSRLDLEPYGFTLADRDGRADTARAPWFLRAPGALPAEEPPPELEVVRVSTPAEVEEFEAVSVRGFGGEPAVLRPRSLHPPSILVDRRMTMLTGRVGGEAVAAAMGFRAAVALGIYGVTTLVEARGRGYGSVLTRSLIDPALPAVLSPTPMAERLYRRLGFVGVGELRQWHRR